MRFSAQWLKRLTLLREASFSLDVLKTLTRLAKDTGALEDGAYIGLQEQLQDVGRQLGGWIKAPIQTKKSA